jgi:malate synthase
VNDRINLHGLQVDKGLHALINDETIPSTGIDAQKFWEGFAKIIKDLSPKNEGLLERR